MIAHDDSELLLALGSVAGDAAHWGPVLRLLETQMQASRVTLYVPDRALGAAPPPRPACFDALRPGRVYSAEELIDRAGPFDPDFGLGDSRVIVAQGPHISLWLHKARGTFRATDSARLSSLMPHVIQSYARAQAHAEVTQALADAHALQWRAGMGCIGPRGPDATAARLLAEAGCAAPVAARGEMRVLPGGLSVYGLPDGTTLLRAARTLPPPDQIARALGLTLSEARLARALGHGQSLPDASTALGLTRETGRSYAKQIYAKTGVSGQSGLMRLLWCGALAFG